jgi:hypothetical protein
MRNESRMLKRPLALILLGDGLITVFWGPGFLYWQRRLAPRWYHPLLDWLLRWPDPLLRLGAAAEAFVGWRLLRG